MIVSLRLLAFLITPEIISRSFALYFCLLVIELSALNFYFFFSAKICVSLSIISKNKNIHLLPAGRAVARSSLELEF